MARIALIVCILSILSLTITPPLSVPEAGGK